MIVIYVGDKYDVLYRGLMFKFFGTGAKVSIFLREESKDLMGFFVVPPLDSLLEGGASW